MSEYNIDEILEQLFKESEEIKIEDEFNEKISRIGDMGEVFDLLDKAQQNRITIKEIVAIQSPDFIASCKEMKAIVSRELAKKISFIENTYETEMSKLQEILKDAFLGKGLKEILEAIAPDWTFLLRKDKTVLYKCYNPALELREGFINNDRIRYEETIYTLQGIYVNVMHDKITGETIHLAGEGHHPAVEYSGYGSACPGSLENEPIRLDKPEELKMLLDSICKTYEVMYVSGGYYSPDITYEPIGTSNFIDARRDDG